MAQRGAVQQKNIVEYFVISKKSTTFELLYML